METQLFNLKFASKQLQRQSRKCDKQVRVEKLKLKRAIEAGNKDGARIYAENAIRNQNQAVNYLRLSSRIDAVASRVETAVRMKQVTRSMSGIVKGMDKAMKSMNLEKISQVMDQFEKQFEDLDVQSSYIEQSIGTTTALSTPSDEVDTLINQVADEHGLNLQEQLGAATPSTAMPSIEPAVAAPPAAAQTDDADDLLQRLQQLRAV
jgi:charged multivesicular body protein 1